MSHSVSKWIFYIVSLFILYLIFCAVLPFWHRYEMQSDLDAAALYATKHGISETRALLINKAAERGYELDAEDFTIEKDEKHTAYITLTYMDEISFFGITLKELEFTLEASARETKEAF